MDTPSNFTSPLEIAQIIPIYTYVNIISEFLFLENQLQENDQYKHIPTVNALYKYFESNETNLSKKLKLVRKILEGTDLYGSNSNETVDETFINTMFEYFVKSLVFEKYTNFFGFLANVTLSVKKLVPIFIIKESISKLTETKFENEFGPKSMLSPLAVRKIVTDMILPLFPIADENYNIFSPNYVYAQAGLAFLRSSGMNAIFYSSQKIAIANYFKHEMYEKISFDECLEMGHLIEQMTLTKKIEKSTMTVFSIPALLFYIHNIKTHLTPEKIESVINKRLHWVKAFQMLFSHLESKLNETRKSLKSTAQSEFYSVISSFKNRTTIARELIEKYCLEKGNLEERVENYKNSNDDYFCYNFTQVIKLPDLKEQFMNQIQTIGQKFYLYEYQKLKEAFGIDFLNAMNRVPVEVYQGFYLSIIPGENVPTPPRQLLTYPTIAFKCHFLENNTNEYYALIEKNSQLHLMKESDNPELFRKQLNLEKYPIFYRSNFPIEVKKKQERFEQFLKFLAIEQRNRLGGYLESSGYDETRMEWWTNFGLSLIPFYTCVDSIFDKYQQVSYFSCVIDSLMMIPFIDFAKPIATSVSRTLIAMMTGSFKSIVAKQSLQMILRTSGSYAINGYREFSSLFRKNYQFGIQVLRLLDPGFEISYRIGTRGMEVIENVLEVLERKRIFAILGAKLPLQVMKQFLKQYFRNVGRKYDRDVYVNSLDTTSGYGFKYMRHGNEIAELRNVDGKEDLYIVRNKRRGKKVYRKIDPFTWTTKKLVPLEGKSSKKEFSNEGIFQMTIHQDSVIFCEGGNFLCVQKTKDRLKSEEIERLTNLGMDEPELFYDIQHRDNFRSSKFKSKEIVKTEMERLYPNVNNGRNMGNFARGIFESYDKTNAFSCLRFEDYLAIRYFGGEGYNFIRGDTDPARRMKNAIYQLAIRQSRDPIEEYATELFRAEVRDTEQMERIFRPGRQEFELSRFTSTSTDPSIARLFGLRSSPTTTRVMYQMRFERPYLRSRVEKFMPLRESETILLAGTKFKIDEIKWKEQEGRKVALTVILSHDYEKSKLLDWQKNVMKEIKALKKSGTTFYTGELKK